MRGHRWGGVLVVGMAVSCGSSTIEQASSDGTGTGGETTTSSETLLSTASSDSGSGGDTSSSGSSSSSSGFFDPTGFLMSPDAGADFGCDPWTQNCPPGQKCMPYSADGHGLWTATWCVDIDPHPDQVEERCTVEGSGVSGIDSCDLGLMCWDVDPKTNEGTCTPMCIGDATAPLCEDPTRTCRIAYDGVVILCLTRCHPLVQECSDGRACYPIDDGFACLPDGQSPTYGDPCSGVCSPGLVCVDAELFPGCSDLRCCASFCELPGNPFQCPDSGEECVPYYEPGEAPPGYEDLGVCLVP